VTIVKATLQKVWGYQGDTMHLPVQDLAAALPFYYVVAPDGLCYWFGERQGG
jgi:hypothetical protein